MTQLPPPQEPPQPPSVVRYGTGVPTPPQPARPKSKTPAWTWVLVGFVAVCCVIPMIVGAIKTVIDGSPTAASTKATDGPAAVVETPPTPAPVVVTTEAAPPPPPTTPAGPATSFGPGMYEVGVEVKAGTYTCTATGGFGAYWERARNASGEFDAIIANGNIKSGTQGIVTIKAKEFFKIDRGTCTIR